jgi:hypothetical protein
VLQDHHISPAELHHAHEVAQSGFSGWTAKVGFRNLGRRWYRCRVGHCKEDEEEGEEDMRVAETWQAEITLNSGISFDSHLCSSRSSG